MVTKLKKIILFFLCICMSVCVIHPLHIVANEDIEVIDEEIGELYVEPVVLNEDESLREEDSKTFIMSDGSIQKIIYSLPIHYEEQGEWSEIDNTLVDDKLEEIMMIDDEESDVIGYENKKSDIKIKFSKKAHKNNLGSIQTENYKIKWGIHSDNKSDAIITNNKESNNDEITKIYDQLSSSIIYEDIFEDISLEYVFDSQMIKENIIIKYNTELNTFTFSYKVDNLTLELNENGEIEARDNETDELVFIMPRPYMIDANDERSEEVSFTLTQINDKKYEITITADKQWMNDETRAYPVTIDPVIQTIQKRDKFSTAFITEKLPTTNHKGKAELLVGNESSEYHACRTLVKFELPSLSKGDMIVDARMVLYGYVGDATTTAYDLKINAHMIEDSWTYNTVTWNTRPDYEDEMVQDHAYASRTENDKYYAKVFDVTNAVKRWYEGETNNGILLKASVETTSDWNHYDFKFQIANERFANASQLYPYIALTYRNNKGLESYWDYTSVSNDRSDTIHINNYSGNPVIIHDDITTTGTLPVNICHIYNGYQSDSQVSKIKPYAGKGFKLNIQQTVRPSSEYGLDDDTADKYPYAYMDEDGTVHFFIKCEDGTIVDEDGLGLTLTENESSTTERYVITDKSENVMKFNQYGRLKHIVDHNGNTITLSYGSGNITKAEDSSGNIITLTMDEDGYLTKITDQNGKETTYSYTEGRLTTITDPYGNATTYEYDSDGGIIYVRSDGSRTLKLSYTTLAKGKRVSQISEYAFDEYGTLGQTIKFSRSNHNTTLITTNGIDGRLSTDDDIVSRYEFDNYGRLKSISSQSNGTDLGATNASFSKAESEEESELKGLNRINKVAGLSPYTENLLKNHSGESTDEWTHGTSIDTATYSFSSTSAFSMFGKRSLRLEVSECATSGRARFYQHITSIEPNTTYTFSGYIKTLGIEEVEGQSNGGALLQIYVSDSEGASFERISEFVTGTTDTSINDEWRRVSITFTTSANATYVRANGMIRGAIGIAYFDGLQLEEGESFSDYNLVENSSFEDTTDSFPDSWTGYQLSSSDVAYTSVKKDGTNSFRITAENKAKYVYQDIPISGSEEDTYVVSGWSYGKGKQEDEELIRHRIAARITYSDGTSVWKNSAAIFNESVSGWSYASASFDLSDGTSTEKTPTSIRIAVRAHRQPNSIYFDNIQLTKKDVDIYKYDDEGNLIKEGDKRYTYNTDNKVLTETDGIDTEYTYSYDNNGNITKIINDIDDIIKTYTYDADGNQLSNMIQDGTDGIRIKSENTYDEETGLLASSIDENGNATTYAYDDNEKLSTTTDRNGNVTTYAYDSEDRLSTITSGDKNITITYDEYDRISELDVDDTNYRFTYNYYNNPRKVYVNDKLHSTKTYSTYNAGLKSETLMDGTIIGYTYDVYGNIKTVSKNDNLIETRVYDKQGNLVSIKDETSQLMTRYEYDSKGNIIREDVFDMSKANLADKWVNGLSYGYDEHDRLIRKKTRIDGINNNSDITYGEKSRIEEYQIYDGRSYTYSYDGLDRLTLKEIVLGENTNLISSYVYETSQRGSGYTTNRISKETLGGVDYIYSYDNEGNITSITFNDKSIRYQYDIHNRLIREDNQQIGKSYVYDYDDNNNIKYIKEYAYSTGTLSNPTKTTNYQYDTTVKDRLVSYGNDTISYDANGDPTNYRGNTLTWDGRELTSISDSNNSITYEYGSNGQRTSKTVNGEETKYYYLGDKLVKQEGSYGSLIFSYDESGNLARIRYKNASGAVNNYFTLVNSRGDVIALYGAQGGLTCRYVYDSWGKVISVTNASGNAITSPTSIANLNPIRYRGYYLDTETGYYYLESRYYDPEVKRFISEDDTDVISLDITSFYDKNLYAYCDDNPVNKFDVNGHWGFTIAGALVGAGLSLVSTLISNYLSGQDLCNGMFSSIISGAVAGAISTCPLITTSFAPYVGAIASYAGAATESLANEVESYYNGKNISLDNVVNSSKKVITDTMIFGTFDFILGIPGEEMFPTKSTWVRPTSLDGIIKGNFAKRIWKQIIVSTGFSTYIDLIEGGLK